MKCTTLNFMPMRVGLILASVIPCAVIAEDAVPDRPSVKDEEIEEYKVETVIVYGEKVVRTLRETPASTVLPEADARRLNDVIQIVPNVLTDAASPALPAVRGIDGSAGLDANSTFITGAQPRVNTLVDGVSRPYKLSSVSSQVSIWDVESIEVARGPQSTTDGRNSFSGAIRIRTRDPVPEPEFAVRAGYFTEQGTAEGALMANLPLVSGQAAARFTAEYADGQSYVDVTDPTVSAVRDDLESEEFERYRGKLLLTPDALPDSRLMLSIDHTVVRQAARPQVDDPYADDLVLSNVGSSNWLYENEQTVFSAALSQRFGDTTELVLRASYLDNTGKMPPSTLPNFDLNYDTTNIATEALLRFADLGFVDKGVVGVAYEHQEDDGINDPSASPVPFFFNMDGDIDNYGIFGEIEASLGRGFTAIVGGRYQRDERRRQVSATVFSGVLRTDELELNDSEFLPKIGVRYDGSDYYTAGYIYSEGYRAGGLDFDILFAAGPFQTATFDPEHMQNHEIWARINPTIRLSLNASLFYYEFTDLQIRGAANNGQGPPLFAPWLIGNIPEATGYGMDLDARYSISDTWQIRGGLGLLDTEITDAGTVVPQFEGQELSKAPDTTASIGLSWLSRTGFDAHLRARYVASYRNQLALPEEDVDDYALVDLTAGYEAKLGGADMRIDAFVWNLADERYALPSDSFLTSSVAGRPRTFGVAITATF